MRSKLNILWATDGSDSSLTAVPLIRSLLPGAATIHVLTVGQRPRFSGARLDPTYFKPRSKADRKLAEEEALAIARAAAERLRAPASVVKAQAKFGHPIQEILRAATREDVDREMHDQLFAHHDQLQIEDLIGYAANIDLDVEEFTRALTERRHHNRVHEDAASAEDSGAGGTPTFFIGGKRHSGAWDTESLARALEASRGAATE